MILVESGADEVGNGKPFLPGDLKNEIITFLTNYGRNPDLSNLPLKLFYQSEFIKKHNMKLMSKYRIKLV